MIDKVKSTAEKYDMLREGTTVVVAVSGGSDSMVLLNILCSLKEEYGFNLCAAHVNHGIRGETAERDERFVSEKCRELGVELHIKRADVPAIAAEQGMGLEECGRNIRYEFFNSLGDDVVIATAHNLSDRAETFLFNFARGSALRGLCSIPPIRENIIRPLIDCTKEEILEFCEKNLIEYVTDETNADVRYSRNRIRHNIITELREINPSFEACARRCMDSLNEDERFLSSLADDEVENSAVDGGYDAKKLANLPLPVKKRAIVKIIELSKGVTVESKLLGAVCDLLEESGSVQINGGVTVRVRKGILDFPEKNENEIQPVFLEETDAFAESEIRYEIINRQDANNLQNISNYGLEYRLDYDKIHGRVTIRSRAEGDKITLASRKCTKSLKKLFNELSIAPEKRNSVAVFADDDGVILVEGAGVDARVAVDKTTVKILKVNINKRM